MGAHVTVLGRTAAKAVDAKALGAREFIVSADPAAMSAAQSRFDLIIDTVPVEHDLTPYLPLLDVDGTLTLVGQIGGIPQTTSVPLIMGRRRVAGSLIGGIRETQEMLEFCAKRNILPECEMIRMDEINEAFAGATMAAMTDIQLPHDKVNVNGGATALGHPIGASGARLLATLVGALRKTGGKRGVATLCIGGGEAVAMAIEMV
ncbi:hypothetical protein G6F65_011844 [Rhizopus arrhizus]|nr:hypothetical protein G6F65_011844 [Rhizopus arrhizus]